MTKYLYALTLLVFFAAGSVRADFKSNADALSGMKKYAATYFAETHSEVSAKEEAGKKDEAEAFELKRQNEIFTDLLDATKFLAGQKKWDEGLLKEVVRVAVLCNQNDQTLYAGEVVSDLYKKDKKTFLKELQNLPAADSKLLEQSIKNSLREKAHGNG